MSEYRMLTDAGTLATAISKVCPILDGSALGKRGDSSTFRWEPAPEATPEQIEAAKKMLREWDWSESGDKARAAKA